MLIKPKDIFLESCSLNKKGVLLSQWSAKTVTEAEHMGDKRKRVMFQAAKVCSLQQRSEAVGKQRRHLAQLKKKQIETKPCIEPDDGWLPDS